jgi:hypothetical protein
MENRLTSLLRQTAPNCCENCTIAQLRPLGYIGNSQINLNLNCAFQILKRVNFFAIAVVKNMFRLTRSHFKTALVLILRPFVQKSLRAERSNGGLSEHIFDSHYK